MYWIIIAICGVIILFLLLVGIPLWQIAKDFNEELLKKDRKELRKEGRK